MTNEEIVAVVKQFQKSLAGYLSWIKRMDADEQEACRNSWMAALDKSCQEDVQEIAGLLCAGNLQTPPFSELPQFVRNEAYRLTCRRQRREAKRNPRMRGGQGMREAFSELLGAKGDREKLKSIMAARFQVESVHDAYTCPMCRDTGLIEVWSRQTIVEMTIHEFPLATAYLATAVAACTCEAGMSWRGSSRVPKYQFAIHCRCRNGDINDPQNLADLEEWCHLKRQELEQSRSDLLSQ